MKTAALASKSLLVRPRRRDPPPRRRLADQHGLELAALGRRRRDERNVRDRVDAEEADELRVARVVAVDDDEVDAAVCR